MADQALKLMTVDDFLAWDDGTDTRYELADGVVQAMAPPVGSHRTLVFNISGVFYNAFRGRRPCRGENEAGVRISQYVMWQADLAVTCRPAAPEILDPLLVVEVLSPSTRAHDLGRKLNDYKSLPSVQEIWMVDSERRWLQHWRRTVDGWIGQDFVGQARFDSGTLGMKVELDEVYADSGL